MPSYQYRCAECGKAFERTETISEHESKTAVPEMWEHEGVRCARSCLRGDVKEELRAVQAV
jgi:putative FmdB family regulatory protein